LGLIDQNQILYEVINNIIMEIFLWMLVNPIMYSMPLSVYVNFNIMTMLAIQELNFLTLYMVIFCFKEVNLFPTFLGR